MLPGSGSIVTGSHPSEDYVKVSLRMHAIATMRSVSGTGNLSSATTWRASQIRRVRMISGSLPVATTLVVGEHFCKDIRNKCGRDILPEPISCRP